MRDALRVRMKPDWDEIGRTSDRGLRFSPPTAFPRSWPKPST